MSLATMAWEKPTTLTTASKYTTINGLLYLGLGVALIFWPGLIQTLFRERAFTGDEQALFRVLGFAVAVIGYYLVIGGHSGSRPAAAASVFDRLFASPLVLLPLAMSGVFPRFLIFVVIADVSLAIGAWVILRTGARPTSFRPSGRAT